MQVFYETNIFTGIPAPTPHRLRAHVNSPSTRFLMTSASLGWTSRPSPAWPPVPLPGTARTIWLLPDKLAWIHPPFVELTPIITVGFQNMRIIRVQFCSKVWWWTSLFLLSVRWVWRNLHGHRHFNIYIWKYHHRQNFQHPHATNILHCKVEVG